MTPTLSRLHDLLFIHAGFNIPFKSVCSDHEAPADYLSAAFDPAGRDLLVWACRGGGKTLLAAVATWLDLVHAPGRSVRILAGSKEQGRRMLDYLHLLADLEGEGTVVEQTDHSLRLLNGSVVDVLAHAETSVRGHHVDTLRCDEIELFDADVFTAALFTADRAGRSAAGGLRRGHLEALSTMHRVGGLMAKLVDQAGQGQVLQPPSLEGRGGGRVETNTQHPTSVTSTPDSRLPTSAFRLLRWCLLDVLERCPPSRACPGCLLAEDCAGRARQATGYYPIDSAIRLKSRVSRGAWEAEALCRRPSTESAVFPMFDPVRHIAPLGYDPRLPLYRAIDLGFTNPSICLWLQRDGAGMIRVLDELVVRRTILAEFARQILLRTPGPVAASFCDPAAGQHALVTASTTADELRRLGVPVRYAPSRIADGIEQIRAYLDGSGQSGIGNRPDVQLPSLDGRGEGRVNPISRSPKPNSNAFHPHPALPLQGGGAMPVSAPHSSRPTPRLLIAPQCTTLISSLSNYRYPHPGEAGDPEKPIKDGENDHAVDALRYFFIGLLGAQPVKREKY